MPYQKAVVYFWSGTGNSYRVSQWLGEAADKNGVETQVSSIDRPLPMENIEDDEDSLLGLVFPTHGFTAPWHFLKFVWSLPRRRSTHAFCVATRAGMKFGPIFLPGISGTATFIVALILAFKGYRVRGTMSVDMPSNWFSLHPIQSRKSHRAIIGRAEQKVAGAMARVLSGKKLWLTVNNLYEGLWGTLLSLVSLGYLCIGRFFLAKLFFANQDCNGCGLCAEFCSVAAIEMWGVENSRPYWKLNCESCMRCAAFCPKQAIEAGHSWGIILYFITAVPVSAYLFSALDRYVPGIAGLEGHWVGDLLDLAYFYPAIVVAYFALTRLMRIPAVNWLLTHTTLTHWARWGRYREPGTQLKQVAVRKKLLGSPSNKELDASN